MARAAYPLIEPIIEEAPAPVIEQVAVRPERYAFVDLLRGFALIMMVETHVVNAYLPAALRKGSDLFFWLSFVNGLVAPGFLFAAGFSIILQADRKWESWLHLRKPFWIQMRRLGFITLVAYYTHLYGFRLSRYLQQWNNREMWMKTLQVDVLQCIVLSLLVIHVLIFVLRDKRWLPWAAGLLAILAALVTPWIWAHDFRDKLPLSVALFLNPHKISLFPIFPWICFVLAGSCACCLFLISVKAGKGPQFMSGIFGLGFLMIIGGLVLRDVPYSLPGLTNFYTTSPLYLIIRIGCILVLCGLLYRAETRLHWMPRPIRIAGQESLLVYGVHMWLIYSILRGKRLGSVLGLQAGYLGCLLMSAIIIVAMLCLARYWQLLKQRHRRVAKSVQVSIVLTMILVFLLN
jgi:uncharacterized membrane protein